MSHRARRNYSNLQKDIDEIKKNTRSSTLAKVAAIFGIISVIISVLFFLYQERPKPDPIPKIELEEKTLEYLSVDRALNNEPEVLSLLMSDISEPNKTYYITDSCVTKLFITNMDSEYNLRIKNFTFYAENIIREKVPDLCFDVVTRDRGEGPSFELDVVNNSEYDIKNLDIEINDVDNLFQKYFKKNTFEISILKSKEEKTIAIADNEDLKMLPSKEELIRLQLYIIFSCDNLKENLVLPPRVDMCIILSNDGINYGGDGFGNGPMAYGILIDTSQTNYSYSSDVDVTIDSGDILGIPICFIPDYSCSMDFYVDLLISSHGKEYHQCSPIRHLRFSTNPNYIYQSDFKNGDNLQHGSFNYDPYSDIISFPYADKYLNYKEWLNNLYN